MGIPTWYDILSQYSEDYKSELDKIDKQIQTIYEKRITEYIKKYYISIIESKIISIELYDHNKNFRKYLLESIKTLLIANGYNVIKYEYYENYNKEEQLFIQYCFYSIE